MRESRIKSKDTKGWRENKEVKIVLGKKGREERGGGMRMGEMMRRRRINSPFPPPQTMRRLTSVLRTAVRLSPSSATQSTPNKHRPEPATFFYATSKLVAHPPPPPAHFDANGAVKPVTENRAE